MQQIVVCLSHQNALRAGHVISSVWGGEGGGEEGSLDEQVIFCSNVSDNRFVYDMNGDK